MKPTNTPPTYQCYKNLHVMHALKKRVHVTDGCQGCLAHPCMEVCPKDAVSLDRTPENL